MTKYYTYVAIALIIATIWQCSDISHIKIKTVLIGMSILQCYILYELVKQNSKE